MNTAFISRQLFTGHEMLSGQAVLTKEGKVTGLVRIEDIPANYLIRELGGYLLAPAFIDLQIYGGNGKLFSTELTTEDLDAVYGYCLQGRCTQFMIPPA